MEADTHERPRIRALIGAGHERDVPSSWQAHLARIGAEARLAPPATYSSPDMVRAPRVGRFTAVRDLQVLPMIVKKGDTIGSIDCLGLRFPVMAPRDGLVEEVFAGNDAPVEFGQPLVRYAA